MELNLDNLKRMAQDEVSEAEARKSSNNDGYPIVYPGENGKLTVRLLFNLKSGIVQRRLIRHNAGKGKVTCMQLYGEDCPVCQAISNAESLNGKECGAFSKYGYKIRGICYAQIIDYDPVYFKGSDDPKKGDTVLLMYPKMIYDQINGIIVNAGDNLEMLLSNNNGIPVVIERSQKKGGYPDYNTYVYPYGPKKSFEDTEDKTGDELFDELLSSLPDLNVAMTPSYPDEKTRESNRALAELINQEYTSSSVMNPDSTDNTEDNNVNTKEDTQTGNNSLINNQLPIDNSDSIVANQPDCFGHHSDSDKKCMLCTFEAECYMKEE